MIDLVTFGEAMVRHSPPHFQRLEQTRTLDVHVAAGAVAVGVGGELVSRDALMRGELDVIADRTARFLSAVAQARGGGA